MIDTAAGLPANRYAYRLIFSRWPRGLANRSPAQLDGGVVITVPAYFDDAQRQGTKDAARLAGLQHVAPAQRTGRRRRLPTVWTQAKKVLLLLTIRRRHPSGYLYFTPEPRGV